MSTTLWPNVMPNEPVARQLVTSGKRNGRDDDAIWRRPRCRNDGRKQCQAKLARIDQCYEKTIMHMGETELAPDPNRASHR